MRMCNVDNKNTEHLIKFPTRLDYRQSNSKQQSKIDREIRRLPGFPDCPKHTLKRADGDLPTYVWSSQSFAVENQCGELISAMLWFAQSVFPYLPIYPLT